MEFLALLIWLLLGGLATVLAPFALTTPGNALAAGGVFAGVAGSILYIVLGAPDWAAWLQVGAAAVGLLGGTFATAQLVNGDNLTGGTGEEIEASALGLLLPFLATVLFCAAVLATGLVEPVVS